MPPTSKLGIGKFYDARLTVQLNGQIAEMQNDPFVFYKVTGKPGDTFGVYVEGSEHNFDLRVQHDGKTKTVTIVPGMQLVFEGTVSSKQQLVELGFTVEDVRVRTKDETVKLKF